MKETIGSMRVYFFIVGTVTALAALAVVGSGAGNIAMIIGAIVTGAFGAAFFYAGSTLETAVKTGKPGAIRIILYVNMAVNVLVSLPALGDPAEKTEAIIRIAVSLLIGLYLLVNLKRLVKENQMPLAQLVETAPPPIPTVSDAPQAAIVEPETAPDDD